MARFNENKLRNGISLGLLAVAGILAITLAVKLTAYNDVSVSGKVAADPNQAVSENDKKQKDSPSKKIAESLKKKNMFAPPPPPPQPPKAVQGILGDEVLIGGKRYKAGSTIPPGAKVISIEATCVKIEWKGKEIILAPIKAASSANKSKGPPRPHTKSKRSERKRKRRPEKPVPAPPANATENTGGDDLDWLDLPANLKEKFRKFWDKMTPEQQKKSKERWQSMSEEQKQQAIESMSQMPD